MLEVGLVQNAQSVIDEEPCFRATCNASGSCADADAAPPSDVVALAHASARCGLFLAAPAGSAA
jgi:hypothetical protein